MKPLFPWKTMLCTALAAGGGLALWWMRAQSRPPLPVPSAAVSAARSDAASAPATLTPAAAADLRQRFWEACSTTSSGGPDDPEREVSRKALALLDGLSAADLALLLAGNETEEDHSRRSIMRKALFENYACLAPEQALALARGWPPEIADELLTPLLAVWRLKDPGVTALVNQIVTEKPGSWEHLRAAFTPPGSASATGPVPRTLDAALAECRHRAAARPPDTANAEDMEPLLAWAAKHGQWQAAFAKLPGLPGYADDSWSYRQHLHNAWVTADWRAWLTWMKENPEVGVAGGSSHDRDNLFLQAADSLKDSLNEKLPRTETAAFLDAWIQHWMPGHPVEGPRDVFTDWAKEDPAAASAWLASKPAAPWRDDAAIALAETTVGDEPESALAWAGGITDPALRKQALTKCWQSWRQLDPVPADTWMDTHHSGLRTAGDHASTGGANED